MDYTKKDAQDIWDDAVEVFDDLPNNDDREKANLLYVKYSVFFKDGIALLKATSEARTGSLTPPCHGAQEYDDILASQAAFEGASQEGK